MVNRIEIWDIVFKKELMIIILWREKKRGMNQNDRPCDSFSKSDKEGMSPNVSE
jgi:hypothetical protein